MDKILSISIAAYNVAECIEHALNSLIGEKDLLKKLEIIIVNSY